MKFGERCQRVQTLDLQDVILKLTGNTLKEDSNSCCLFPNHPDTNASVRLYDNNSFYCFGCRVGGGPLEFVSEFKAISKYRAVILLEEIYKLDVPHSQEAMDATLATATRLAQDIQRRYGHQNRSRIDSTILMKEAQKVFDGILKQINRTVDYTESKAVFDLSAVLYGEVSREVKRFTSVHDWRSYLQGVEYRLTASVRALNVFQAKASNL